MPQIPTEYQIQGPAVGALLDALYGEGIEHDQGALATSGMITTQLAPTATQPGYYGTVFIEPAAAITAIVIQPGVYERQNLAVVNNSAFTATPDVLATSNVLSGSTRALIANSVTCFRWYTTLNSGAGAWAMVT